MSVGRKVSRGVGFLGKVSLYGAKQVTETVTVGALADGAGSVVAVAVAGAAINDTVLVGPPDLSGMICSADVSAAGTVKLSFFNKTGGTVTLGAQSFVIRLLR